MEKTKIYSGFFLDLPIHGEVHATWEFNPGGCNLPAGEVDGNDAMIHVIGDYNDNDIDALVVEVQLSDGTLVTHQPGGTILHITLETRNGVSPVQSGLRAMKNGWEPRGRGRKFTSYVAKAGFFKA